MESFELTEEEEEKEIKSKKKPQKPKVQKQEFPFTVSYEIMGHSSRIDKTFKSLTESNRIIMDLLSKGQVVILKPQA